MCDDITEMENEAYLAAERAQKLSRRGFTALAGGVGAATLTGCAQVAPEDGSARVPGTAANAPLSVVESKVEITTPDGVADCYFVHPAKGKHAAVLIWPDIMGLRPAFEQMGKRLAESGYSVLVVNPFYRAAKAPILAEGESFQQPEVRNRLMPMARALTAETNVTDAKAFVGWLDAQKAVDTSKKVGTTGYCMGGPLVFRTAAALPDRIGAAGTFHGGGLATTAETSPHLLIPQMKARFLIAIATNDDENDPESKVRLRQAFDAAGLPAEIEVYQGAMHGWCPPDAAVYNQIQAERAWSRMLALFDLALA